MASVTMKRTCARCNKGGGTAMCYGCELAFCTKHFIEHRQELSQQMDNIGQEHDLLQRDLVHKHTTHPLLARIDQWEHESITKIQVVAETARTDLRQLLDRAKNDLKTSLSKTTIELQSSRESDDSTEIDITKWTEQLNEIRKILDNPSTIKIDYDDDTRSAICLIKVSAQHKSDLASHTSRTYQENDCTSQESLSFVYENFDETFEEVELSEKLLKATCLKTYWNGSSVSCIGRYSSGTHPVRFRIEQKTVDHPFFFGIVTASQKMTNDIWFSSSAYGWWDFDDTIVNGNTDKNSLVKTIRTGDELILILDCDNQRIELQHDRTNKVDYIPIVLQYCPFPWKITVSLFGKDDCVRILH